MTRLLLAGLAAILLVGCAAKVVSSNPRSVVVDAGGPPPARDSSSAQRLADAECSKHGRFAKMIGRPQYGVSNEYVFDCVQ